MPGDVRVLYEEARGVARDSPRASGALLRVALERLVVHLGGTGSSLDLRIRSLAGKGLPSRIVDQMDVLRIIGNHAAHPGEIDLDEQSDVVMALFAFLNVIVEATLAQEKMISAIKERVEKGTGRPLSSR